MILTGWIKPIVYFLFAILSTSYAAEEQKQANGSDMVQFEPYKPAESYKCGQFIESSINDPAMRLFHRFNNAFIKLLSQPFPHEKLLSSEALLGQPEAWRSSLESNHQDWIEFEKYWLAICATILVLPVVFTVLYLLYRCCVCCCRGGKKSRHTDNRFDSCQRVVLNGVLGAFVFVNVFAAVVLLINTQYAQYNIEELPTRLHYCVNDFSVYKIETNERIRKLLRDDFQVLNATLIRNFNSVGANVVNNFKKSSGLTVVDQLLEKTRKAEPIRRELQEVARDLRQLYTAKAVLSKRFSKLKESEDALDKCRLASNVAKAGVCESAWQLIQPILNNPATEENPNILPEGAAETIQEIIDLNIEQKFSQLLAQINSIENTIQGLVDTRQEDAVERLKLLEDTLFHLYENISAGIKSVDLRFLDDIVDPMMQNREKFRNYVQYSWIISLIITGIFVFIALSFLLGLFYGCCGRRPSYHDDDCCVRSTGGKFYSCGIWMCLAFMTFFAVITAILLFIGANASSLICLPMEDPLSRPDMLSLVDRIVEVYGLSEDAKSPLSQDHHIPQIFDAKHRPVDVIKGCSRGATFYTMFGLDKKFQLANQGGPRDDYDRLSESINRLMASDTFRLSNMPNFYNSDLEAALQKLADIHVPTINRAGLAELRSWTTHFDVDPLVHQLRKITAEKSSVPMPEVDVVIAYLEALKPDAQVLLTQIKNISVRLEKLVLDLESLQLNGTDMSSQLQHTSSMLAGGSQTSDELYASANQVVLDHLVGNIDRYAQHINHSMMTEISSCGPIKSIAENTRAAVCDYTLDPFNGVWMAMAISLLLMFPIIVLSTRLTRLYGRIHPFPKYIINEPSTEATFATDTIYGPGLMAGAEQRRRNHKPYTPVSSYANNYGYQEFYPPPYGGHNSRGN